MTTNAYIRDPIRVVVYDPMSGKNLHTEVFLGDVPKNIMTAVTAKNTTTLREFYGSDFRSKLCIDHEPKIGAAEEFDDADIELLLNTKAAPGPAKQSLAAEFTPGVGYTTDVHIFPEDNFTELMEKIFITLNIPVYRQHLFYIAQGRAQNNYQLHADGIYNIDIRNLPKHTDFVAGVPIDRSLYDIRRKIRIEAQDTFKILGESLEDNTVFVCDLGQFTGKIRGQLADIINDTYQMDLFYYGFVIKYWPRLLRECFHEYVQDEADLQHKYPDLAKNKTILGSIYRAERDLINTNYKNAVRAAAGADSTVLMAITQMIATVSGSQVMLNIRNLFDKLRATRCIPEIHAYIEHNNRRYLLRKRHIRNGSDIQFPSGNLMKTGITLAISLRKADQESFHTRPTVSTMENEQSRYMFLNIWPNGKYLMRTMWNEEDELGFEDIITVMKKFTDPIIRGINSLGKYVFVNGSALTPVTKQNINYQSLNICIFWKKVLMENTFKLIRGMWDAYMRARIVGPRNVQQFDKFEFIFRKGMYQFDAAAVDRIMTSIDTVMTNQYSYLVNNSVKQKWEQSFDGRIVKMSHRTTDIRFEVSDIREKEFQIFYQYIVGFVYRVMHDDSIRAAMTTMRSYKDVKKLRKLREQDPELYNLKKHGSKKVYSIICQNQRQPLIYTQDELKAMPAAEVKKLRQYWNFTLNKPAYYGCPNKKYPHLSFMVGAHPKHYCLPCCNIKPQVGDEGKKMKINSICMQRHKFISTDAIDEASISRHVMSYGKNIDIGRLSKLPQSIARNLLVDAGSKVGYYVYGVAQHVPGVEYVGLLYSVAEAIGVTMEELIRQTIAGLRANPGLFLSLLNGTLIEFYQDIENLLITITELFLDLKMFSREIQKFKQWPELFAEMFYILFNISIFTFIDESGSGETVNLFVPNYIRDTSTHLAPSGQPYVIIIKRINRYYPIFMVNADAYFKSAEIAHRRYAYDDKIIQLFYSMISFAIKSTDMVVNKSIDLTLIKAFVGSAPWKVIKLYINKGNLCYAVLLANGKNHVYLPIDYSAYLADGTPIDFMPLVRHELELPEATLASLIKDLNTFIVNNYSLGSKDNSKLTTYKQLTMLNYLRLESVIIGAMVNQFICYFDAPSVPTDIPVVDVRYDYTEINNLILTRAKPAPDRRTEKIGESLYNNYLYQLFVIEFVNYLNNERDVSLRAQLKQLFKETNFKKDSGQFRESLKKLPIAPPDMDILQVQINAFYQSGFDKNFVLDQIESTVYDFDRITLGRLRKMSPADLRAELKTISKSFVVEKSIDTNKITFPNIYLPCGEMTNTEYCEKSKLIINKPLDMLVDILAADLMDDLKSKYLLNALWADTTIDWLNFTRWPTEIITIYRLNE